MAGMTQDLWEELYTLIQQGVSQAESAQRLGLSRNVVQTAVNVGYAPNSRIFPGGRASIRDQLKADKLLTRAEATEYLSAAKEGEDGAASGDRYEQLIQSMDDCLDDVMLSRRDAGVGAIFARRATTLWLGANAVGAKLVKIMMGQLVEYLQDSKVTDPKLILEYMDKLSKLHIRSIEAAERTDKLERSFLGDPEEIKKILLAYAEQTEMSEDESERVLTMISKLRELGPVPESIDAMDALQDTAIIDAEFTLSDEEEDSTVETETAFDFELPDSEGPGDSD